MAITLENELTPSSTHGLDFAELRLMAERLTLALDAANAGFWDWNLETDDVYYSPRWKAMLGYGPGEIPDRFDTWTSLIHPDDLQRSLDFVQCFRDGRVDRYELEFRLRHKNGDWIHILSMANLAHDADGQLLSPRRLVGIHRDATATKLNENRANESLSLLQATLDSTADGILVVGTDGVFNAYNKRFAEIWSLPPNILDLGTSEEILRAVVDQLADPEKFIAKVKDLYEHPERESFDTIRFQDGRVFERYSLPQRVDDEIVGRVWSFRDITDRVVAEEEIRQHLLTELRVRNRAEKAVQKALAAEREAARLKSEFLANISHEFRTPMNGIIGLTDLILATDLNESQRINLNLLKTAADQLQEIMNNVFSFARIEAGTVNLTKRDFDLLTLVDETLAPLAEKAGAKSIVLRKTVDDTVPPTLRGDPSCLRLAFRQVVENAVEFTEQGTVDVHLQWLEGARDSGHLLVEVRDTGVGIPADSLETIFDSFCQVDGSLTRGHGGTGIGLSLCRRLLSMMGGSIEVESTLGAGSVFRIDVPFDHARGHDDTPRSASPIPRPDAPEKDVENLRILLVEDVAINQKVASLMLQKAGHQVTLAENGQQALDYLESETFDVVLMDVQMPVMNGFEATARIRAAETAIRDLPIIAVTAHNLESDRDRCLEAGMNDYVPKPVKKADLLKAINDVVGSKSV